MSGEKCYDVPPWMGEVFSRMVGAAYHKCRLASGHGGLHVNCEGQTWGHVATQEPTP